jgi:hypothetical protein
MKILKVYDKINRNTLLSDEYTGMIHIREYYTETDFIHVIINTKVFKSKNDKIAYLSYSNVQSGISRERLDVTSKYIFYSVQNEEGRLLHSERIHIKDNKSIVVLDRIYDENKEFIELENHKGKRTVKFKIKNEILNNLLNTK